MLRDVTTPRRKLRDLTDAELFDRINRLTAEARRRGVEPRRAQPSIELPNLVLYPDAEMVAWHGASFRLHRRMFAILYELAAAYPRPVPNGTLFARACGGSPSDPENIVRAYTRWIRGLFPNLVETVHATPMEGPAPGYYLPSGGYRLTPEADPGIDVDARIARLRAEAAKTRGGRLTTTLADVLLRELTSEQGAA